MSFSQLAEGLVTAGFAEFGEPSTVTPRGGDSFSASAIISRGAEVVDDYGVVVDSRIEIEFRNAEVGNLNRGTTVEQGSDKFTLLEPLRDNGLSSRWVVSEV